MGELDSWVSLTRGKIDWNIKPRLTCFRMHYSLASPPMQRRPHLQEDGPRAALEHAPHHACRHEDSQPDENYDPHPVVQLIPVARACVHTQHSATYTLAFPDTRSSTPSAAFVVERKA
eukprot:350664-Chlamydomonas_euryale.AAC.2